MKINKLEIFEIILQNLIEDEDYENAAKIRDKIKEIKEDDSYDFEDFI